MRNWSTARKIRVGILAVFCLLLFFVLHGVGALLVGLVLLCYGGIRIYTGGLHRIGRINAEEAEKLRLKRESDK